VKKAVEQYREANSRTAISRRGFVKTGVAAIAGGFLSQSSAFAAGPAIISARKKRRVFVLGLDGMSPYMVARLFESGGLPNLKRLSEIGSYSKLATSDPPQSPVAWSCFITGMNPGGHGIFDFVHRDPETIKPYLSTSRLVQPSRTLGAGKWSLPISGGGIVQQRKGRPFWEYMEDEGVSASLFRIPATFPPKETSTRLLSGLGVPDMRGSYGVFTLFTDDPKREPGHVPGGDIRRVQFADDYVATDIAGPDNNLLKVPEPVRIPLVVRRDRLYDVARISIQGTEFILNKGEWSGWVRVKFAMMPAGFAGVSGICRFYLKQVHPVFELYVSPINIDPADPAIPISSPASYSRELCERFGPFYTQGIAEDNQALSNGVLDHEEYLAQAWSVLRERERIFDYELGRFREGFFFHYVSCLDVNQHMLWWTIDPQHPMHRPDLAKKRAGALDEFHAAADAMVGRVLKAAGPEDLVIVMSDHGFASFRRCFGLNDWLLKNGYLKLKPGAGPREADGLRGVDWSETQAYGLGINSLYVNLHGREAGGVVPPGDPARALVAEIVGRLEKETDPATGENPVSRVLPASAAYSGGCIGSAPDAVVCYNRNYRSSWESVLGGFTGQVCSDNMNEWTGDHCMDSRLLAGVLFANRKLTAEAPSLVDLPVTILAEFGIPKPEQMEGRDVLTKS